LENKNIKLFKVYSVKTVEGNGCTSCIGEHD